MFKLQSVNSIEIPGRISSMVSIFDPLSFNSWTLKKYVDVFKNESM